MARWLYGALAIVVALAAVVFSARNARSVPLDVVVATWQMPLGVLLLACLLAGCLLAGLVLYGGVIWPQRRRIAALQRSQRVASGESADVAKAP